MQVRLTQHVLSYIYKDVFAVNRYRKYWLTQIDMIISYSFIEDLEQAISIVFCRLEIVSF